MAGNGRSIGSLSPSVTRVANIRPKWQLTVAADNCWLDLAVGMDGFQESSTTRPITDHGMAHGRVTRSARTVEFIQDGLDNLMLEHEVFRHEKVLLTADLIGG
jgi:hypothetical protein